MTFVVQGNKDMRYKPKTQLLASLLLGLSGAATAFGQATPYPAGDLPYWLQEYGYESGNSLGAITSSEDSGANDETMGENEPETNTRNMSGSAQPQPAATQKGILCRPSLLGDWGGRRTTLRENGIIYRGRVSQYFFGVEGGIQAPLSPVAESLGLSEGDRFSYTGNSRHDFLADLEKFGGMPHGKFALTMENLWGEFGNVGNSTGATTPTIFNSIMPVDPDANGVPRVTNFLFIQPLSENFVLSVGKARLVNVADSNIFAGGDGSDQFLNQAFVGNPLFVPQLPLSTFVVSMISPQEWGNFGLIVGNPLDRSTQFMDLGNLFSEGILLLGQVQVNTDFWDLPGEHHIGGFYKNVELTDLAFTPNQPSYPPLPAPPGFQTRPETHTLFYGFDQYLVTYGEGNRQSGKPLSAHPPGWGLFGRAGISDGGTGNPNFNAWHVSGGVGGDSPLASRREKGDRFGFGYSYTATSSEWGPIPQSIVGPRDTQICETYYRYQMTPSTQVTNDIQWVRGLYGGLTNGNDAWVYGIRMNINL